MNTDNEKDKKPCNVMKIMKKIENMEQTVQLQKSIVDKTITELKQLKNDIIKYIDKNEKKTSKKETKPKGFAVPKKVSSELCIFMDRESGSLISRTETTKYINDYIKEKNLMDKQNKCLINPDEKLRCLVGEYEGELTYFNIQKYMNKHFL